MKRCVAGMAVVALIVPQLGCATLSQGSAIEAGARELITQVVVPAVEKAAAELQSQAANVQGQASLINPGLCYELDGVFGTGFGVTIRAKAEGLSANIAGMAIADKPTRPAITNSQ